MKKTLFLMAITLIVFGLFPFYSRGAMNVPGSMPNFEPLQLPPDEGQKPNFENNINTDPPEILPGSENFQASDASGATASGTKATTSTKTVAADFFSPVEAGFTAGQAAGWGVSVIVIILVILVGVVYFRREDDDTKP